MIDEYAEKVSGLTHEGKVCFYEGFAHNLTIAIRSVWSDDSLPDAEKLKRIRFINEILHRVTSKISVTRLREHEWAESDMQMLLQESVRNTPETSSEIVWAITRSYELASKPVP